MSAFRRWACSFTGYLSLPLSDLHLRIRILGDTKAEAKVRCSLVNGVSVLGQQASATSHVQFGSALAPSACLYLTLIKVCSADLVNGVKEFWTRLPSAAEK